MKYKILIILLTIGAIIFCSACNVNYSATLDENEAITERIEVALPIEVCYESNEANPPSSCEEYITNIYNNMKNNYSLNEYDLQVTENDEQATAVFIHKYNSIDEFKDSNLYLIAFSERNIDGNKFNFSNFISQDNMDSIGGISSELEEFNVKLSSNKNNIINTNAESINKETNTYEWKFNPSGDRGTIQFEIGDPSKNIVTNKIIESSSNYLIYIIVGGIIIVFIILLIILAKLKNANRV